MSASAKKFDEGRLMQVLVSPIVSEKATFVAEKGTIFYKNNGMSNLENIKDTKLYDILLWASEQKDHEEFINEYYDSLNKTN